MTKLQILAQVVAVAVIIMQAIGAHAKSQKSFLLWQVVINAALTAHYILLGGLTAIVVEIICVLRTVIFYMYERKGKETPLPVLVVIIIMCALSMVFTWRGILSVFPALATVIYTYGQWQKNVDTSRKTVIGGDVAWIIYNLFVAGYVNLIGKAIEIISCSIALAKKKG